MKDFRYLYYLTKIDGLGAVRINRLVGHFGSGEKIFEADVKRISEIEGFSRKISELILSAEKNFSSYEKEYDCVISKLEKMGAGVVTVCDEEYPAILKEIYDPPVILYYRGSVKNDNLNKTLSDSIGIVGTRKPTDYGKRMAETLTRELASHGINIISGFARGIDTCVHKSLLASGNKDSITGAVFGCGVDVIYPPENKKLYEELIENGVCISEYEISTMPEPMNFPRRNRIISGLSLGVVVIESGRDGGALITARCALDQSREVFAVPGYVTSAGSGGSNYLIKTGQAKLVENADDILNELESKLRKPGDIQLKFEPAKNISPPDLKGNEKSVYDVLLQNDEPVHIDTISESAELNISDCLVSLLNLEFKNLVKQLPGKRFTISN